MLRIAKAKIVPHLWFDTQAEEAAKHYVSLVPDSRIDSVTVLPNETPSGPPGSVKIVEFTLGGQPFTAMSAGPFDQFNHAISFIIQCEDQAEIDRLWDGLLAGGGHPEQCGWLKDRYGVSWQIVPERWLQMANDRDKVRFKRVCDAMMKMVKLDLAALEKAYEGG